MGAADREAPYPIGCVAGYAAVPEIARFTAPSEVMVVELLPVVPEARYNVRPENF